MNLSEIFIHRPIGTTLLTLALALLGITGFFLLPVSPLPQVDFPTISVSASLPGASPDIMASSVATPLERQLGNIASVSEMTSTSYQGSTSITLQFDLSRNIDAAARDVQAAINAARANLPADLPNNPTWRKVNPADAPILILALTSDAATKAQMYDAASTVLQQKLSQVRGVGQVIVGGSSLPAVRVELNPAMTSSLGLSLESLRSILYNSNANEPKGSISGAQKSWVIEATDQLFKAKDYQRLIVSYKNGNAVRLSSLGDVVDSVQDLRNAGFANKKPAVLLILFNQPGANIINTVDRVDALIPQLQAAIPASIRLSTIMDRTTTVRASVKDVERTLIVSIVLVIFVVFLFLRNLSATLIPAVVVPLSLIGTFGAMYLLGYSIDNLSLMALTICTGFVVDDAVVVIENITRYIEKGFSPLESALRGSAEVGFTVLSISISLIAVFIPILMMGGIVGRLLREFAMTLSVAILISMVISLTTTPMMCAHLLKPAGKIKKSRLNEEVEGFLNRVIESYGRGLEFTLRHKGKALLSVIGAVVTSALLFIFIPKGFFPQEDTGRMMGGIQADQNTSFQAMQKKLKEFVNAVLSDPSVVSLAAFAGGSGGTNTARMFVGLKPVGERPPIAAVMARIRKKTAGIAGARLFMQPVQDIRIGGRMTNAQYQYTLRSADLGLLTQWAPKLLSEMRKLPEITDVNSDQQNSGLAEWVYINRDQASRFGLTASAIDNELYDAFGQRPVSTMYTQMNQYFVVMEVAPRYWQSPETLKNLYIETPQGGEVPLSSFAQIGPAHTPLVVNHSGLFPSVTVSFNLRRGFALGQAVDAVEEVQAQMRMPASIIGQFSGTAQAFKASLANEFSLVMTALLAVYIVLGILYESYIHPLTIISTLPSAGTGALLALLITHTDLSIIALIGIILLIGIVKKNAILMIDFAIEAQRNEGKNPLDAIREAALLRFRPITMTTLAALFGAIPLALGSGTGSELRRPLGIAIMGGLIVSQMLTLFTTPVVYLYMEDLREWLRKMSLFLNPFGKVRIHES